MRYWRPWRMFLIWLNDHVSEKHNGIILDYLYPDDCVITFQEAPHDD